MSFMINSNSSSSSIWWWWLPSNNPYVGVAALSILIGYILFEIGFFFHYHQNLIPFANQIFPTRPPAPYRDYIHVDDRVKLLSRIIDLLNEQYQSTKTTQDLSKAEVYYNFIESWFCKRNSTRDVKFERFSEQLDMTTLDVGLCPPLSHVSSFGGTSLSEDDGCTFSSNESLPQLLVSNIQNDRRESIGRLRRDNMDEFLSWAFFGIDFTTVESSPAMKKALDHFYTILQSRAELHFDSGRNSHFTPRWFTFESVKSLYRPFGVYAAVALMRFVANCFLYIIGFRQYTCKRGLRYWHRSAFKSRQGFPPFMFFHGIAPGGYAPYLPMVLFGLLQGSRHRDIFFFENKPISYALCFDALSEEDTVHGVLEAVHRHLDSYAASRLTLCGHSFGTFQLTWMINSPQLKHRVRSIILLDPVSILLHDPDVVVNFLYTRIPDKDSYNGKRSFVGKLVRFFHESKIHLVASSELFVEYNLRRKFAWYNSELWLDDIPPDVQILVCLAKNDEIANSNKIEREIRRLGKTRSNIKMLSWDEVGHAHCISSPDRWSDIRNAMNEMEKSCED